MILPNGLSRFVFRHNAYFLGGWIPKEDSKASPKVDFLLFVPRNPENLDLDRKTPKSYFFQILFFFLTFTNDVFKI